MDVSGALMARATVQVQSANGTLSRTTRADRSGAFDLSGLPPGIYRLAVSKADFETKEITITLGLTEPQAPLRIAMTVSAVNSTVEVERRNDDLTGIATSAT